MTGSLASVLDRFGDLRVLVVGDIMLDRYLAGPTTRLCQEAPVPVVAVEVAVDAPGGAANVAANVRALGARPVLLGVVGPDGEAAALRRAIDAAGVDGEPVIEVPGRRTLAKSRVLTDGQMVVRFDQGSTRAIEGAAADALISALERAWTDCDVVIVSDYGYGVGTDDVVTCLERLQRSDPRPLAVDAKDPIRFRGVGVTAVKPNHAQALRLLEGTPGAWQGTGQRAERLMAAGEPILDVTGAQVAVVTLDREGAVAFERGRPPYRTYVRPLRNASAAGAGDTFVTALALALAAGAHTPAAAELASAASAVVLGKDGTAVCSGQELRAFLWGGAKADDPERVLTRLEFDRSQGRRIVLTNGCFDILHRGHITYLNRAKALGDVLVVGINSDDSVRQLKGPERPVNPLDDRIEVLAALSCVDHIVAFDELTPVELVRAIRPDVFVKGGDYTREMLPEAPVVEQLGGTVHILPYVEDRSTTSIIERIRRPEARAPSTDRAGG
jgi:D-beta-D-heptose 7-phosphate kinase/D-beta-D-heptose 1-phosphate adenosyltransferase